MRDGRRTERERPGESELEDRRPKTHQESVVVAPTDERTDGRINRGSHLLFTRRALCTRAADRYTAATISRLSRAEDGIGRSRSAPDRDHDAARDV